MTFTEKKKHDAHILVSRIKVSAIVDDTFYRWLIAISSICTIVTL